MNYSLLAQFGALLAGSFVIAVGALWLLASIQTRTGRRARGFMTEPDHALAFLFEDDRLVNATDPAKSLLACAHEGRSEWDKLVSLLLPRFPDLNQELETLAELGRIRVTSRDGLSQLHGEWRNGLARLSLIDSETAAGRVDLDRHSLAALERELEALRKTADHAPFLAWRQQETGAVSWANRAYLDLTEKAGSGAEGPSWPPARLFDPLDLGRPFTPGEVRRLSLKLTAEAEPRWFDISMSDLRDEKLYIAVAADRAVKAETSLRDFVQTLTKTFAHLTVGLAIFDKNRKLTLFNPALSDLTHLPPEFLIARPSLQAMLDRLREKRIIPEPKDYKSWRQRMSELEAAAQDGTYEETWSLASGQTYRVTGRPHPDGAVAFLFEDISAEISLTRRFRAELETGQAVLDSLDEAIAVFSPGGSLTLSNSAYARLWGADPSTSVGEFSISDATRSWNDRCAPTPVWGDLREYVTGFGDRTDWIADVRLRDGRLLACRFAPLPGGATLVGFKLLDRQRQEDGPADVALQQLRRTTISA